MYQAKSGVKNFSLYWKGGSLDKKFFLVWTCIKPNLVSKIFPFTGGGGVPQQKFFPSLNMYKAKLGVKKFSLYWDWVPPLPHPPEIWDLGPPPKSETGYPPLPENLRPGTPSPPRTDTHLWKHNLPSYVRTRAVNIRAEIEMKTGPCLERRLSKRYWWSLKHKEKLILSRKQIFCCFLLFRALSCYLW